MQISFVVTKFWFLSCARHFPPDSGSAGFLSYSRYGCNVAQENVWRHSRRRWNTSNTISSTFSVVVVADVLQDPCVRRYNDSCWICVVGAKGPSRLCVNMMNNSLGREMAKLLTFICSLADVLVNSNGEFDNTDSFFRKKSAIWKFKSWSAQLRFCLSFFLCYLLWRNSRGRKMGMKNVCFGDNKWNESW